MPAQVNNITYWMTARLIQVGHTSIVSPAVILMQLIMSLLDSVETADVSKTQVTTPHIHKAGRKACELQRIESQCLQRW